MIMATKLLDAGDSVTEEGCYLIVCPDQVGSDKKPRDLQRLSGILSAPIIAIMSNKPSIMLLVRTVLSEKEL